MPEFGDYLGSLAKLRLGVAANTPKNLAAALKSAQYTEFDAVDIAKMRLQLEELILEIHGEKGLGEFQAELARPKKKGWFR
jgi:hypothetical protein